ncbi:hypothetical protein M569_12286 [Genlisea aurea]|uniref:Uncharacterized protein n=1 Tax=Genlisea aurea TaxID=192259 RepID=S8DRS9_9LAMI|nr:hypothetical protein M569_12286 [Genlisea aurea]
MLLDERRTLPFTPSILKKCIPATPTKTRSGATAGSRNREKQNEDDTEYYRHRKASPLSEFEFSDTRKPITRATDGTGGEDEGGIIVCKAEQVDSAGGLTPPRHRDI